MFEQVPFRALVLASISAPLLSACAGYSDQYPSLAIRDAERIVVSPPAAVSQTLSPLSEETVQRLGSIVAEARESHQQFLALSPIALDLARSASGEDSESDRLARAIIASAQLSSLRGETSLALSRLDALEADSANALLDIRTIRAAQSEVSSMMSAQDAELSNIEQALR